MDPHQLMDVSIATIERQQHPSGGYSASPNFAVYRYCWLRDGSFIADAMSRIGRTASADAYFRWCALLMRARAGHIASIVERARHGDPVTDAELLPTRYELDGRDGVEPWANFQLDGYGLMLHTLVAHAQRRGLSLATYGDVIAMTVDYLTTFGTRPCFDWWEESPEYRHTSTLVAVWAGLRAAIASGVLGGDRITAATVTAAEIEEIVVGDAGRAGHLTKWIGSDDVDGSTLACVIPLGFVAPDHPIAVATVDMIRCELAPGGVYRYRGDTFYGGGEWIILTAWLGLVEHASGDLAAARTRLIWICAQATASGFLPEQVSTHAQHPEAIADWQRRWGPVATPLLWSHAMYLHLAGVCGI
jgi:isomaltose glucohydrolase